MASSRDRRYESSTSTTECSSSCPSPSSPRMSHTFSYRPSNNAPKYGTMVPNRIFVGGLLAGTTEMELLQLFSAYGNVKSTKVISDRAGVSKGYGFVTFETEDEARRLVQQETITLHDRRLNIAPAIKKQPFSRVFGPGSAPSATGIRSGPVFIQNSMPLGFQNGLFCILPQMSASQIPVEADSTSMAAGGDPVFHNTMLSASSATFSPMYPISHQPVYLPTQYQYPPFQSPNFVRTQLSRRSPNPMDTSSSNAQFHAASGTQSRYSLNYEMMTVCSTSNEEVNYREGNRIRNPRRWQQNRGRSQRFS